MNIKQIYGGEREVYKVSYNFGDTIISGALYLIYAAYWPTYRLAMARIAGVVIPDVPHHVTQRSNRRQPVFFNDDDRRAYLALVAEACAANATVCIAWCLTDNHVHLILDGYNLGTRSPRIVEAVAAGTQPKTVTRKVLLSSEMPLSWEEQERMLGLAA